MPDRNITDVLAIMTLVKQGWNYCSKKEYKDFNRAIEEKKIAHNKKAEKKSSK